MNRLDKRLDRLWRATHTFVTARDCHLIATYWKTCQDDTEVTSEDLELVTAELQRICSLRDSSDENEWKARLNEYIENNYHAYCAFMHETALRQLDSRPQGYWVSNNFDGFLRVLNSARELAVK